MAYHNSEQVYELRLEPVTSGCEHALCQRIDLFAVYNTKPQTNRPFQIESFRLDVHVLIPICSIRTIEAAMKFTRLDKKKKLNPPHTPQGVLPWHPGISALHMI